MAVVHPFKGFLYSKSIVDDFRKVVTQPYDKTTPSMQDAYYESSPFNVVRITLNIEKRENPDTGYAGAGSTFRKWIEEGVLVQDPAPAIYAYYQEHSAEGAVRTQRGFIALLDLQNSESGIVPHEQTLAAPKQDRLHLMRAIEGNEDLIYMLYSDAQLRANQIIDRGISGREPEIEVADEYGATHRLWAITDPEAIEGIQCAMQGQKLFIADGHHRFETSVTFMEECLQKGWRPAESASFDKRMVACFNVTDGVTILPTHRLIRDLAEFDVHAFLRTAEERFTMEIIPSAPELWLRMQEGRSDHVFGFYPSGTNRFYLVRLRNRSAEDSGQEEFLDVRILHSLLLERGLGIDESKLETQAHIDYERDRDSCIRWVDDGKYQAAFFLNPTTAEQMQQIASRGKRMPQKSTDFYPKLLTGLVFMKMNIRKD